MKRRLVPVLTALATLAAVVAFVLPTPAASAATFVVKENLGRRATYYNHFGIPSKGQVLCTAQGQTGDTNGNGIADSLRVRGACLEISKVKRVAIYRLRAQVQESSGAWTTVQVNDEDKFGLGTTAYAVQYTAPNRFCATDPTLQRTYRAVHEDGIRWDDNLYSARTTYSNTFEARALASDPACPEAPPAPSADLEVTVPTINPPSPFHNEPFTAAVRVVNNGPSPANGVTVTIDTDDRIAGRTADVPGGTCTNVDLNPDPAITNEGIVCTLGTLDAGEVALISIHGTATTPGTYTVTAKVTSTSSYADTDTTTVTFVVRAFANLSLDKALASDDDTPASGSTVSYTFTVHNAGLDTATSTVVTDDWPGPLGTPTVTPSGDATCTLDAADHLVCAFGTVLAGATETVTVSSTITADPDTPVTNTAVVNSAVTDPDSSNNDDSVTVVVGPAA